MDVFCKKCGDECLVFNSEIFGECHLCQKCDKQEIINIAKEHTENLINKRTDKSER